MFSIETALVSKIGGETPTVFMRRSFDLENIYTKEGEIKTTGFFSWTKEIIKMDIKQVRTVCNSDAFIYVYFLRMWAYFFTILSVINLGWVYIYLGVDEQNPHLSILQSITILSMYGSKTKVLLIYMMTFINSIAAYIFLYIYSENKHFKNIFAETETHENIDEYVGVDASKTTIMVSNIPPEVPVIEANTLLGQIFKSRFRKDLEAVHSVGWYDKVMLDKLHHSKDRLIRNPLVDGRITLEK